MNQDGLQLKFTRHCKYQSGHHFVWIPFKRRKIFRNETIIAATKKYVIEAIENNDMTLIAIEVDRKLMPRPTSNAFEVESGVHSADHVHIFVSIPPRMSASQAVNVMKGYSSRHLRKDFEWLKKLHDKPKLWASSYYWGTTGNVSAQAVKRYIQECQG